jgi:preprotein translocase subunit SecY
MVSMSEKMAKGVNFSAFSKATDLHKRLWFTLLAIIVFRLGTYIPFPGINPSVLNEFFNENQGGLIGMFNAFTGGALSRMSIFALNIMPYISASIIIQLAASIFPSLIALKKEGEVGMRKMQQYTRILTILITVVQAYFMALALERGNAVIMPNYRLFELSTIVSLLGGTMFVVWLGEQMTARGVGNGTSILIMVGIVANIPMALMRILEDSKAGSLSGMAVMGILAMIFAVIYLVVLFETAQRRIVIQYPKHQMGGRVVQGVSSHLPLKINPTGVMPPIFASALLAIPVGIAQYFSKTGESDFWNKTALLLTPGQWVYVVTFAVLIVFFTFFYTGVQSNPKETAENLKRQGGFVAGIRPGENTAKYLDYVITRLTVLAAIYLTFLCILPEFLIATFKIPFFLGGTTLLIVVSVILETFNQTQSHLLAYQYEGLIKKAKLRGRF